METRSKGRPKQHGLRQFKDMVVVSLTEEMANLIPTCIADLIRFGPVMLIDDDICCRSSYFSKILKIKKMEL